MDYYKHIYIYIYIFGFDHGLRVPSRKYETLIYDTIKKLIKYVSNFSRMLDVFKMCFCVVGVFCIINCYFKVFIGFVIIFCIYEEILKVFVKHFRKMSQSENNSRTICRFVIGSDCL